MIRLDVWTYGGFPYIKRLCIVAMKVPGEVYKLQFLDNWTSPTLINAAPFTGNTTIKHLVSIKLKYSLLTLWTKFKFHEILDVECWTQLARAPCVEFIRVNAFRMLFGYIDSSFVFCNCADRGTIHYLCRCPETHAFRSSLDPTMLDYIHRSFVLGKFHVLPNLRMANRLLSYLANIFQFTLHKFPYPTSSTLHNQINI